MRRRGWMAGAALAAVLAGTLTGTGAAQAPAKKAVRSIDDLPRYGYPYRGTIEALFDDPAVLAPLAAQAKRDVEATLAGYAVEDRATLRALHGELVWIALLRGDYPAVRREVATLRSLEDKPLGQATAGDVALAYAEAAGHAAPGTPEFAAAFRDAYAHGMEGLSWALYGDAVLHNVGADAVVSPALILGSITQIYGPQVSKGGALTGEAMAAVIRAAGFRRLMIPLKPEMIAVDRAWLAAHQQPKPDIWPARDVALTGRGGLHPVVVAVWDGGFDASLFPGQLWTNPRERVDGRDDDGNGFVDDVHGIAADLNGARSASALAPVPADMRPQLATRIELARGMIDQMGNLPTPQAAALVRFMDTASAADIGGFFDTMGFFGEYAHGTHVAGIVARDNPAVRMMTVRNSFDWRSPPARPTLASAQGKARSYGDAIAYMKAAGVRVVNMSWTVNLATEYENPLADNGVPQPARADEARRLFAIDAGGLRDAIASAPDILFVCAAGNADDSAAFAASVPAAIDAPNVLTVAAVGPDGVPTSFTSAGPTIDIAANGFEVDSLLPGGAHQKMSGTSMASPNVVNAAAKLLALHPELTVAQLRAALVDTATPGQNGLKLLDLAAAMRATDKRTAAK